MKTTSKQNDGAILSFRAKLSKDSKNPKYDGLVLIDVLENGYHIASYYLGTLAEWGEERAWCVASGPFEKYRAVNNSDAEALIKEASEAFPNDESNYRKAFSYKVA